MAYSDSRSSTQGCLLVIGASLGLLALPFIWASGLPYTSTLPVPFDSERWKAASVDEGARCGMIADLRLRVGVDGRTRAELVRLLGEPENRNDDPSTAYWLLCPSFLDIWVLEVRWHDGRAASARVRDT